jgi:hypothetical protein
METYEVRRADPPPQDFTRRPRPNGVKDIDQICWHGTRGNAAHDQQVAATEHWFANGDEWPAGNRHSTKYGAWGGSTDFLVGFDRRVDEVVIVEFGDWVNTFSSWSAGFGSGGPAKEYGAATRQVAIEVAEVDIGDKLSPDELDACAFLVEYINAVLADDLEGRAIPFTLIEFWNQKKSAEVPRGHISHARLANGVRLGKTDISEDNFEAIGVTLFNRRLIEEADKEVTILEPGRHYQIPGYYTMSTGPNGVFMYVQEAMTND